jgi:hypothetical protein
MDYAKESLSLFANLSQKQKEIIVRRFGLMAGKERQTLEMIGDGFGLTRERVRQIIEAALSRIRETSITPAVAREFLRFKTYLTKQGGLKSEKLFFNDSLFGRGASSANWLNFLLTLEGSFYRIGETEDYFAFWTLNEKTLSLVQKVLKSIESHLKKAKKPLAQKELVSGIANQKLLGSCLEISKNILKTDENKYGLRTWPEVNPRGVRDLALLVFRKIKKPLHFTEVATLIDKLSLRTQPEPFSVVTAATLPKKTNFQTVHNELIKDPRFILVGRGTYALNEWGYNPGTVKEVISKVIKEAKQPLSRREILKRVLSQRLVKESTILLNLGNKKCFLKSEDGRYSVHEA